MMYVVTGSDGFIGSHFKKEFNSVISVEKHDAYEFLDTFNKWEDIELIIHQGAISDTREDDEEKLKKFNIDFSIKIFETSIKHKIPISYASTAAIYGNKLNQINPLNKYASSKLEIDNWVKENINRFVKIQGFRYFNVFGENEEHKIKIGQASPVSTFIHQAKEHGLIKLFEGSEEYFRDFIYVNDIVRCVLDNQLSSGIYDLGTSEPVSFEYIGRLIAKKFNVEVEYIPFPKDLKDKYQTYTCSNTSWDSYKFTTVSEYLDTII